MFRKTIALLIVAVVALTALSVPSYAAKPVNENAGISHTHIVANKKETHCSSNGDQSHTTIVYNIQFCTTCGKELSRWLVQNETSPHTLTTVLESVVHSVHSDIYTYLSTCSECGYATHYTETHPCDGPPCKNPFA